MSQLPQIQHLINGQLVDGGTRQADVFNPATGQAEKRVLLADKLTVEQAIASAQAAFPAWRNTPPLKRARVMSKLKELLEANSEAICALVTAEHGKVLSDSMGELQRGALKTWNTPVTRLSCSRVSTARMSARPWIHGASFRRWV